MLATWDTSLDPLVLLWSYGKDTTANTFSWFWVKWHWQNTIVRGWKTQDSQQNGHFIETMNHVRLKLTNLILIKNEWRIIILKGKGSYMWLENKHTGQQESFNAFVPTGFFLPVWFLYDMVHFYHLNIHFVIIVFWWLKKKKIERWPKSTKRWPKSTFLRLWP